MLAFVAQVTFADDVIASFTFPDADITANPSSAVAGTGCTVTYRNLGFNSSGSLNAVLDGKYYHKMNNDNNPITITLNSGSFQAGDKFVATLYCAKNTTTGFYFKARSGNSKTIACSNTEERTLEYTLTDADIDEGGSVSVFRFDSNTYVRYIEVTRATGTTKETPTTEFATEIFGFKLSDGTASQTVSTNSDGAVAYESSNNSVVTIDASTGTLTAVAVGKATITAKTSSSSTYAASSASYTVYVLSDGDGSFENPYLPTDCRYVCETFVGEREDGDKVWAKGYIVGVFNSTDGDVRIFSPTVTSTTSKGTVGLANTLAETSGNNCLAVQLISNSEPSQALNLADNWDKKGSLVWIYGQASFFTQNSGAITVYGLSHADFYSLDGETIVPEPTGVNNITVDEAKAEGKIYNLSGMEVKTPAKGVYIQNGKKFVVK